MLKLHNEPINYMMRFLLHELLSSWIWRNEYIFLHIGRSFSFGSYASKKHGRRLDFLGKCFKGVRIFSPRSQSVI